MQTPEKPFNDFFLLGLSHLSGFEALFPPRIALQENQIRLEYGKKAIKEHTAKGDLIAFETPEENTFEHYKKIHEAMGEKITHEKEKELLARWQNLNKVTFNIYFELAQYAERIGRRVVSLEPSIRKPASALMLAYVREPKGTERKKRMRYLLREKPDISFLKRIQRLKPKMVIVARGHAVFIKGKLNPAKEGYFPEIREWHRKRVFEERLAAAQSYKAEKMARLKKGRMEAKRRKPI